MTEKHPLFAQRISVEQVEFGDQLMPRFDAAGLLPAIVVDAANDQILMLAQMNAEALARTLESREAHFWSRSREAIWRKGEHSGFTQTVKRVLIDDDQDAIILFVEVHGPGSCHVGYRSCFYREIDLDSLGSSRGATLQPIETEPVFDAEEVYAGLPNPTKL